MKAYILSDKTGDCEEVSLVFADTAGKAKMQANQPNDTLYQCELDVDWIDLLARRAKSLDDMENASEKDICIKLIKEDSWYFEVGNKRYDADNIDEFIDLWKRN